MKVIGVAVGWGGRPGERVVLKDNFVCLVKDNY